tara:strand:+ start:1451 stop:1930 length:480 start_codon:yes stop_codon:yes gene_type:complete
MYEHKEWYTGSNHSVCFSKIKQITSQYVRNGGKVYIGSDSFISRNKVSFASTICLHGPSLSSRYFFFKESINLDHFINLCARITEEAKRSVEIAEVLLQTTDLNTQNIELHLDISSQDTNNGTSRFSEMLTGYVLAYGLECKIKPNAWAGQTIADKHSK